MPKLPYMQFYPADWIQDTRVLSLQAAGAWINLLCAMWCAPDRGKLQWTPDQTRHFLGLDMSGFTEVLNELILSGIGDIKIDANFVMILSRRMVREEVRRQQAVTRQSRRRHAQVTRKSRQRAREKEKQIQQDNSSHAPSHANVTRDISEFRYKEVSDNTAKPVENDKKPALQEPSADLKKSEKKEAKKLDEKIKAPADRIYAIDHKKFDRLIAWIKQAEQNHTAEAISLTLQGFEPYAKAVLSWWPYLDSLLDKTSAKLNARQVEEDNDRFKREIKDLGKVIDLSKIVKKI